jgi:hypothetical protein
MKTFDCVLEKKTKVSYREELILAGMYKSFPVKETNVKTRKFVKTLTYISSVIYSRYTLNSLIHSFHSLITKRIDRLKSMRKTCKILASICNVSIILIVPSREW